MSFGKNTHKGKYRVKNVEKYVGDENKVTYRSSWERAAFLWADKSSRVKYWNSEEMVVPYRYTVDGRLHRYFIDLYLEMADGSKWLIEIKPSKECRPPTKRGKKKDRYLQESLTWVKNCNKWEAAKVFATKNGMTFAVWDEHFLKKSGIMKF